GCDDNAHPPSSARANASGAKRLTIDLLRLRTMQDPRLQTRTAARNRLTNDGMRRCQRLPELTHPVDFARPTEEASKRVPRKTLEIREAGSTPRHLWWT